MVGGFGGRGVPNGLIEKITKYDLTIISNDTGDENKGISKLIQNGQVKKLICSYLGLNSTKSCSEIEVIPQGLLAERIRAFGVGINGISTNIRGYPFYESAIGADVAIVKAYECDNAFNLRYRMSDMNFNKIMAMAGKIVIAEIDNIVDYIDYELIKTPGILVDYVYYNGQFIAK